MIRKAESQNDVHIKNQDTRFDSAENRDLFEEFSQTLEEIAKKVSRRSANLSQPFYMESAPALPEKHVEQLIVRQEVKAEKKDSIEKIIEQPESLKHESIEQPKKELKSEKENKESQEKPIDEEEEKVINQTEDAETEVKVDSAAAEEIEHDPELVNLAADTGEAKVANSEVEQAEVSSEEELAALDQSAVATPEVAAATKSESVSQAATVATAKAVTPQNAQTKIDSESVIEAVVVAEQKRDSTDLLKPGLGTKPLFSNLLNQKDSLDLKSLQLDDSMLARVQLQLTKQLDLSLRANNSAVRPQTQENAVKIDTASVRTQNNARLENQKEKVQRQPLTRVQQQAAIDKVEGVLKEAAKSKDGKSISFRLDPPELGKVKVDLTLRDGGLHARLVAESPQVNNLLREKAQDLQLMLRKLGLNLEQVRVSVGSFDTAGTNNQPQQEQPRQMKSENTENFNMLINDQGEAIQINGLQERVVDLDHWVA